MEDCWHLDPASRPTIAEVSSRLAENSSGSSDNLNIQAMDEDGAGESEEEQHDLEHPRKRIKLEQE